MKKKKSNHQKNRTNSYEDRYAAPNLEPPRVYRQEQFHLVERNKNDPPELTRQQKRERQNTKRRLKRSVRKAIVIGCIVLFAAAMVAVLSLTVFFRIDSFAVSGSQIYTEDQVLSALTISTGDNLFLADTDKAAQRLTESLPYVYKAEIKRKLPATIRVQITDAEPGYVIRNQDKSYTILDDHFKVLENGKKRPEGTILIKKATVKSANPGKMVELDNAKTADCLQQLAAAVKAYGLTEATAIYSEGLTANYILYDDRILFKLGTCDNLEKKIYQGLAACETLDADNPTAEGTLSLTGDKQYYFTEK